MAETVAGARYVVGFMFNYTESKVLLLHKTRPSWQFGKLNGVGGRVEDGETPSQAMMRECAEETGIESTAWCQYCKLSDERGWEIYFFRAVGPIDRAQQTTDEKPVIVDVNRLPRNVVTNLRWLIPMAWTMTEERASKFEIKECGE